MKKFTKTLAAFCAMAMIFGMFSATVFADENEPQADQPVAEEVAEEEKQDEEPAAEAPASPAAEEPVAEEPEADAEAPAQDSEQPVVEGSVEVADVEGQEAVNEDETETLFANGWITQDDIDANGGKLPETAGSYTLTEDVTVTAGAVLSVSDSDISINLDGYTIAYTGSESMYKVGVVSSINTYSSGITLTIFDDSADKNGKILADWDNGYTGGGSVDNWTNGTKIGPDPGEAGRGGCIQVEYKNTFILSNVEISGFYASEDGGGVFVSNGARFEMHGGKITNCSAAKGGGAVAVHASSNKNIDKGIFIMYDGEISGNKADFGGAIRCNRAALYLYGGVITNNKATGSQGGGAVFAKQDKGVYPDLRIKGDVNISGNTAKTSTKANMYLDSTDKVTLAGALNPSSKIYINGSGSLEIVVNGNNYSLDSFVCDNPGYEPYEASNGNIKFSNSPKIEGYQVVIGGDIKLRSFLDLKAYAESNTSVSYAYSYTKGSKTVNVEKTFNFSDLVADGSFYCFDIPVESACITAPVTVTINYDTDKQVTGDPVTIEQYVKVIVHGDYAQKVKDVAWALLYFGSFAMMQFNINMDPSMYPDLEETDANINDPKPTVYTIGEGAPYSPAQDPDGAFYGASVAFLSKTEVNMYFKKSAFTGTAPAMTVTYSGGATETITATLNGNYYMYTIKGPTGDGFSATLFDVPFSYEVGSVSGEYSIETYLKVVEYKYHGQSQNILLYLVERYYDFAKKCQQL